ncbi:hypothetical protein FHR59_002303 [Xanthomonas arboricola]|nr:hypothetical protein [Xanthomonas arboricola]CAG2093823.1 hypothetical protein XCY_003034 [Xanthomonas euroxanthea]
MGSDVLVCALEPVPGQDFVSSSADELHVLTRHRLALNGSGYAGEGLPKVTAIRTGGLQRRQRSIEAFEVKA